MYMYINLLHEYVYTYITLFLKLQCCLVIIVLVKKLITVFTECVFSNLFLFSTFLVIIINLI